MASTGEPGPGGDDSSVELLAPRIVAIALDDPRFLDAHEIRELDFNVVTRTRQSNNTQRWVLTHMGGELFTIMQVSSSRYLDAHEIQSLDFRVVTRPRQNNATQLWRLRNIGGDYHHIMQVSSGRLLTAYLSGEKDFQVVTRPAAGNAHSQQWRVVDLAPFPAGPAAAVPGTPTA